MANAKEYWSIVPEKSKVRAKYRMGDLLVGVRGPGTDVEVERCNIGKTGVVVGMVTMRGDTQHHYTIQYDTGNASYKDSADESCLERVHALHSHH